MAASKREWVHIFQEGIIMCNSLRGGGGGRRGGGRGGEGGGRGG